MHTTASTARLSASKLAKSVELMNAKITAFNSIISSLERSCTISTQRFNDANILFNTKWSEHLRIVDLPDVMAVRESHWDKWARKRVEMTKSITSNVMSNSSLDESEAAAEKYVSAMKMEVAREAATLYEQMLAS